MKKRRGQMKITTRKKKPVGVSARKKSAASPVKARKAVARTEQPSKALDLARQAVAILEEKHGVDPAIVDVRGESNVTDFYVVVSGHKIPHLRAMSDEIQIRLKKLGMTCYRKAEKAESGWLVLDYVDVVIHILLAESRKYYAIEDLWAEHRHQE